MTTKSRLPVVAVVLVLTAVFAGAAHAGVTKPGGNSNKILPFPGPLHGPGSSHNPIVAHPPLHGPGSSHNPIVVPPNCNDRNTLCRRP